MLNKEKPGEHGFGVCLGAIGLGLMWLCILYGSTLVLNALPWELFFPR